MLKSKAREIAAAMAVIPDINAIAPALVHIDKESFPAVRYWQRLERRFRLLGMPRAYEKRLQDSRHHPMVCFQFEESDWYVASYTPLDRNPNAELFEPMTILMQWLCKDKIDAYERRPYRRLSMRVTLL